MAASVSFGGSYEKALLHLLFFFLCSLHSFGQATKVVITTQPVLGPTSGSLMSVQPVVEIRDASNLRVNTSTAQIEIVIASGNGGTLGGTTTIKAVNGIATFTNLTLTGLMNEYYTFQFKSEPVIAAEPFSYGAGTLTGQNGGFGWTGAWFGPNGAFTDLAVNTTGFSYTNYSTSGGRASYSSSTGGDGGRSLAAISNAKYSVIWLSFLGNYDVQGGGFSNVRLYLPGGLSGAVGGNAGVSNWAILNSGLTNTTFTSTPLDGNVHLALLKIDYNAGSSALWMDPAVATFDGTQTPSMTETFAPVFDRIELYNRLTNRGTDEITLASTYKAALHLEQNLTPDLSLAVALPVKWTNFHADCRATNTMLTWGTSDETGNSYFVVERSTDGLSWSPIANIAGAGNSSVDHQYQYKDTSFSSMRYYRLEQVDENGHSAYSKTVSVRCSAGPGATLRVFPNPAKDHLQLTGVPAGVRYRLLDGYGRTVSTGITKGAVTTILLSRLAAGNYFVKMEGNASKPIPVIKTREK